MVARNLGYALLISRPYSDRSYEGRPLVSTPLGGELLPIDVSLAWAAGVRRTRRARAFADHCRQMLPGDLGHGVGAVPSQPPPGRTVTRGERDSFAAAR